MLPAAGRKVVGEGAPRNRLLCLASKKSMTKTPGVCRLVGFTWNIQKYEIFPSLNP